MTDYLGPLSFGTTASGGTYVLKKFSRELSTINAEVLVTAQNASSLGTAIEKLVANLTAGNTWTHLQPGLSNPVSYRVLELLSFAQMGDETWHANQQRVQFSFRVDTLPFGAVVTMHAAQPVNAPASLSLESLLGSAPTTLDVTVDDSLGSDMHSVWLALAPKALTDSMTVVLANAITFNPALTGGTGATCWGNTKGTMVGATYTTAPLDTRKYPAGKYRLLVRAAMTSGVGYVMDSQNLTAVPITGSDLHLTVVGDLDLPVGDTASGVASNLLISVKSDGVNTLTVNGFVLIPLSWGFAAWHPTSAALEIDQLDVGPSGVFMDGVCDFSHFMGGVLVPKVTASQSATLIATEEPSGTTWPTDWSRSASGVTAASSKFHIVAAAADKYATYTGATQREILVVPDEWYEVSWTRRVTAWTSGTAVVQVVWTDVDGNQVGIDTVDSKTSATDGGDVNGLAYVKAPRMAVMARVTLATTGTATLTVDYNNVIFKHSPLRLIVVVEEATGALNGSYVHPVAVTVKYTPRYEIGR